ncbi:LysR family transcriptional regulator [Hydrogenophaga sp. BPS33]|uniref:LysR family transcriptional regulator n=1 Tax=Hydrogenophaga sp. BPS33 TaxID=2651974 RepID=UPI00131F55FF|nr:LysR family transcriptional regulator [Hydrogenophaga sp. BPS33]QHE84177.1 LysR family transcriptional regulator [Hydrogenophaga sp. BPS33]
MNMRQLQYFLAVAHELSFTRAAERVHIAQPPLSQQIIALEEELETKLFIRDKRKVQLTPSGAILVEHAQRVLNAAAGAIAAVRAADRGADATLSVGAIYSALFTFLPHTLRIFKSQRQATDVNLQEMTIGQQINALKEGEIEIGIMRGHVHDRDIASEVLYREPLVVAVPGGSKFEGASKVTIAELASWPLIAVGRGTTRGYSDRIFELFEERDLRPTVVNEVRDMHTSICLVAGGLGVSVVPAVMQVMQSQGVTYRALQDDHKGVNCVVAWRRNAETPLVTGFLDAARRTAQQLMAQRPDIYLGTGT